MVSQEPVVIPDRFRDGPKMDKIKFDGVKKLRRTTKIGGIDSGLSVHLLKLVPSQYLGNNDYYH